MISKSKKAVYRAFSNVTNSTLVPKKNGRKSKLPQPFTSKWVPEKEGALLLFPSQDQVVIQEAPEFMNFVPPRDFKEETKRMIGNFNENNDKNLMYPKFHGYKEVLKALLVSDDVPLKNALYGVVTNVLLDEREVMNYQLVHALFEAAGLTPPNGYILTPDSHPDNHLRMPFGRDLILHAKPDLILWKQPDLIVNDCDDPTFDRRKLILFAQEIKLTPTMFNYVQWLGQFLLVAAHKRNLARQDKEISSYGLAVSGWMVRFGKFTCSPEYLDSLNKGIVLKSSPPTFQQSRPYNLLSFSDRSDVVGVLQGRSLAQIANIHE